MGLKLRAFFLASSFLAYSSACRFFFIGWGTRKVKTSACFFSLWTLVVFFHRPYLVKHQSPSKGQPFDISWPWIQDDTNPTPLIFPMFMIFHDYLIPKVSGHFPPFARGHHADERTIGGAVQVRQKILHLILRSTTSLSYTTIPPQKNTKNTEVQLVAKMWTLKAAHKYDWINQNIGLYKRKWRCFRSTCCLNSQPTKMVLSLTKIPRM